MKVNGTKYQTPCALVIGVEDGEQIFGDIINVLVFSRSLFFEFQLLESSFYHHYHAHLLSTPQPRATSYIIKHKDLAHYHPYGMYHCISIDNIVSQYVVLRSKIYKFSTP